MADQRVAELDDLVGDAAAVHEVAGEHEAGDAEQDEGVHAREHVLRDDGEVDAGAKQIDGGGGAQRDADRHAEDEAEREGSEEERDEHQTVSPWPAGALLAKPNRRASEKKISESGMNNVTA